MEQMTETNAVRLCGTLAGAPAFSHESRGQRFYSFPLEVRRLSGNSDTLNIVLRREQLEAVEAAEQEKLLITGQLRSYNNRRGEGAKLVLTVLAKELLLSGGPDVDPVLYGEEKLPCCGEILAVRDAMELSLFRKALKSGLPVLGICRGLQVMNVALGGTLYQDIATQLPGAIKHPCYDTPRDKVHEVTVTEHSRLHRITGLARIGVNSRHHQGVKKLADSLKATAYSEDGLIEAFECPAEKFVMAVQWHPESLSDRYPEAQAIFNAFAEACKG